MGPSYNVAYQVITEKREVGGIIRVVAVFQLVISNLQSWASYHRATQLSSMMKLEKFILFSSTYPSNFKKCAS